MNPLSIILLLFAGMILFSGCLGSSPNTNDPAAQGQVANGAPMPTTQPHTIIGTWRVDANGHKGTVQFLPQYVSVDVSGYPGAALPYSDDGDNHYSADVMRYHLSFIYDPATDTITSDQYPGTVLVRQ